MYSTRQLQSATIVGEHFCIFKNKRDTLPNDHWMRFSYIWFDERVHRYPMKNNNRFGRATDVPIDVGVLFIPNLFSL